MSAHQLSASVRFIRSITSFYICCIASPFTGGVEAKYKNPNDVSQTWTGRGRKPAWVQAQLDEGFSLEDLAI